MTVTVTCLECGEIFEAQRRSRKFCCDAGSGSRAWWRAVLLYSTVPVAQSAAVSLNLG